MSEQVPAGGDKETRMHHWLSPHWYTKSPQHANIYGRYQAVRTAVDFCAAFCFVAGSVLFLYANTGIVAGLLFLVGSLCFAVKPTIDLIRAFHLRRL
jgi:hypothetical protein